MDQQRKTNNRPQSLVEVVEIFNRSGDVNAAIREFLDEFYVSADAKRADMVSAEPPLTYNAHTNAYLAAVAEHLSLNYKLPIPEWTGESSRFLKKAHFPMGLESLKAMAIVKSPVAFRRRMIFVPEHDPLSRPRQRTLP